jgi:hypothetical protein
MRTTVRLPDDLMLDAKNFARTRNRTLTDIIEDGVRRVLNDNKKADAPWVMPPVSSVKGECLVDLTNMAAVLDMLDEDTPLVKLR